MKSFTEVGALCVRGGGTIMIENYYYMYNIKRKKQRGELF
jgi:hypothetical protein